jgi:hypothetical protein
MLVNPPEGYHYKWENNAVYISSDHGKTWTLFMYFPPETPKQRKGD